MGPARNQGIGPYEKYKQLVSAGGLQADIAQEEIAIILEELYQEIKTSRRFRVFSLVRPSSPVKGLYLWGGVGRGKTMLMDMFCDCFTEEYRLRLHFHRFMKFVHDSLRIHSGIPNPLEHVAESLVSKSKILCFDEFYVSDIGDAMILSELLERLFSRGVTLIATSNIEPDQLYWNGLQRSRFLPAIDLLKENTVVRELHAKVDYRLRVLQQAEIYFSPLNQAAADGISDRFADLVKDHRLKSNEIEINGRRIKVIGVSKDVVWFNFSELCGGARSQNDYIELAALFQTILLSDTPVLGDENADAARRFISLIDVLYDHGVNLVMTAAAEIHGLYRDQLLSKDFDRTRSRLLEMQSKDYLAGKNNI